MTFFASIIGILVIVLGLGLSIALHEFGHLYFAKKFGVRVTKYMVGFGPTLWSGRKGETEYGIKILPLGGYIQMIGMYPPGKGEDSSKARSGSSSFFQGIISQARRQAQDELQPGDDNRVFYKLSVWKRIVIMCAGPAMNLVLAVVFIAVALVGFGKVGTTTEIAEVYKCVVTQQVGNNVRGGSSGAAECGDRDMPGPAWEAGLRPGDVIKSVDGTRIDDWATSMRIIRAKAGQDVAVEYQRGGQGFLTHFVPIPTQRPTLDPDGAPVKTEDGSYKTEEVGFVGMSSKTAMVRQNVGQVVPFISDQVVRTAGMIVNLPKRVGDAAVAAFSEAPRDPDGPVSVVGVGRVAGEVAGMEKVSADSKMAMFFTLLGGINLALFVFNLLPLMPLDGGHVAGAVYETVKRRIFRLFGKADPGAVDIAKMLPVTYGVAIILVTISVLLIYADIVKPISL